MPPDEYNAAIAALRQRRTEIIAQIVSKNKTVQESAELQKALIEVDLCIFALERENLNTQQASGGPQRI